MSQSENVTVDLIALQQLKDSHVPQSLSTVSSNGAGAVTGTQANGDCNVKRTGGELGKTKTSIFDRCQHLDTVLLAVVILVVLKLLLLPVVFYHLPLAPVSYKFSMIQDMLSMLIIQLSHCLWSSCII